MEEHLEYEKLNHEPITFKNGIASVNAIVASILSSFVDTCPYLKKDDNVDFLKIIEIFVRTFSDDAIKSVLAFELMDIKDLLKLKAELEESSKNDNNDNK